jgi:RNA polymerase sigma-70 factor (ECF subfamily)
MADSDIPASPASDRGTSLTLIQQLRVNDPAAWSRLVFLYGPLVRYWASRRGVTGADADDVSQDVFQAVVGGLATFRRDRPGDTFRGWLCGITRYVLLRHSQRTDRQPRAAGGTEARLHLNAVPDLYADSADEDDPPAELGALYNRGLALVRADFEERTWTMFWQHTVDGRSVADVAADMGVSPAAVRQAKSRVLRRLREQIGDLVD